MSAQLLAQLKRHEGSVKNAAGRHKAYHCPAGYLTIGYGHNLTAHPISGLTDGASISETDAEALLKSDIAVCEKQLLKALPWVESLSQPRCDVLLNMCFNLGLSGLLGFKNTLAAIRKGDYTQAAELMLQSKWARQVKGRAVELAAQMRTGRYRD